MNKRIQNEAAFHDKKILNSIRIPTTKFYSITQKSKLHYEHAITSISAGKRVLEYGCGTGSLAFQLAEIGAQVIGIDISQEAITIAKKTAERRGLSSNISFYLMNAEKLDFDDNYFDIICGSAILHHLDLDKSLMEIRRVLKGTGIAFFLEPLGHNPLINLYRKCTPELRSTNERPLMMSNIAALKNHFLTVKTRFFHLTTLLAIPFRNTIIFGLLLNLLSSIDNYLFKLPWFRKHAWQAYLELSDPRKQNAT
ncbi:MAG TPA: class I SAM-dependent methyltransferase [candidate division Zixibacteria bacterium]|nr:class I SAM-dependent methyltransferase [candidate division Zixibacteria bacterium]